MIDAFYFEGAPEPHNKKCGNKYPITYKFMSLLPDKYGNPYPTHKKYYIVVSKTANSNKDLTELYLKKFIFTGVCVSSEGTCDHRVGLPSVEFKAHRCPPVKEFCKSLNFLDVEIIGDGLTSECQPLYKAINKVFKGYFCDLYKLYSLADPLNSKTGAPISPTRQILSNFILGAW